MQAQTAKPRRHCVYRGKHAFLLDRMRGRSAWPAVLPDLGSTYCACGLHRFAMSSTFQGFRLPLCFGPCRLCPEGALACRPSGAKSTGRFPLRGKRPSQALARQRVPSLSPKGARGVPSLGRGVCRVSSRAFPTEGYQPKLSLEVRIFILRSGTRGGQPRRCLSGRWVALGRKAWLEACIASRFLGKWNARSSGAGGATSSQSRALPASSVGRVLSNRETSGRQASRQGFRAQP